jgi:hypothetical protein
VPHEQPHRDNVFDCVADLLRQRKWFDVSVDTILSKIEHGERVELQAVHEMTDKASGEELKLRMRLRISGIPQFPDGWHVSLLLYNRRIDGFGYHERFSDLEGVERTGWHRHVWNEKTQDANGKIRVSLFDKGNVSFRDFLVWSFKEMGVSYPKDDDYANEASLF